MKIILNNIDLHIVYLGLIMVVLSVFGAPLVLQGSETSWVFVLVVLLFAFGLFLQPMLLTRGLDRTRRDRRFIYIIINKTVIVAIAFVSFVGVQIVR